MHSIFQNFTPCIADGRPVRQQRLQREQLEREILQQQRRYQEQNQTQGQFQTPADIYRLAINEDENYGNRFQKREDRHQFIKYVYMILFAQLALTASIVSIFKFHEPSFFWLVTLNYWFWVLIMVSLFILLFAISCCEVVRKTFPFNLIALMVFTSLEGLMLSYVVVHYPNDAVLLALGCTSAVCIGLTIFACQTRCDFTVCWGLALCGSIIVIVMGIITIFIYNKILQIVYASIGVAVFSFYLVIDTQMIIGGRAKYQIEPDEYILGALHLYLDVILIFMYILELIRLSE